MAEELKDSSRQPSRPHTDKDISLHFPKAFANEHHAYVSRKAERLATAVHVVTGFVGKEEPIRRTLREISLTILCTTTERERLTDMGPETFAARCAEVAHLLTTAEATGLVSAMNARLIIDEYARLAAFVTDRYEFIRLHQSDIQDTFSIRHTSEIKKTQSAPSERSDIGTPVKDISRNDGRRADILSLFATKDKISIKDAVQSVRGVSEKTIQRDLLAMVAEGVLVKEGERRWSVYRKVT